jgi:hypothetical protein
LETTSGGKDYFPRPLGELYRHIAIAKNFYQAFALLFKNVHPKMR